jgi:UDP-GlcNAc:undecaprenyl-phosphate GlcNAc-1-phosphate transferase
VEGLTTDIVQLLTLAGSPLLAAALVALLYRPITHIGLVDTPDHRKRHDGAVPLAGGPAMALSFAVMLVASGAWYPHYEGLLLAMALLCITGIVDDHRGLRAGIKFALQIGAALILIYFNDLTIDHLGAITGDGRVALGGWNAPFTVLCVVGLINAINMLDGLDGLAGGVVAVMLGALALVALIGGAPTAAIGPGLMLGALLGFLAFNFPGVRGDRPRIFMGDSGSMMLGVAVAWFAIDITFQRGTGVPPIAIAWILALPVVDTVVIMTRRVLKGRHPMSPDREHLHHILQRAGLSQTETTWCAIGLSTLVALVGMLSWIYDFNHHWLFAGFLALIAMNMVFVARAWRLAKLIRRWKSQAKRSPNLDAR